MIITETVELLADHTPGSTALVPGMKLVIPKDGFYKINIDSSSYCYRTSGNGITRGYLYLYKNGAELSNISLQQENATTLDQIIDPPCFSECYNFKKGDYIELYAGEGGDTSTGTFYINSRTRMSYLRLSNYGEYIRGQAVNLGSSDATITDMYFKAVKKGNYFIDATICYKLLDSDGGNAGAYFSIFKNGVIVPYGQYYVKQDMGTNAQYTGTTTKLYRILTLNKDDIIEIKARHIPSGANCSIVYPPKLICYLLDNKKANEQAFLESSYTPGTSGVLATGMYMTIPKDGYYIFFKSLGARIVVADANLPTIYSYFDVVPYARIIGSGTRNIYEQAFIQSYITEPYFMRKGTIVGLYTFRSNVAGTYTIYGNSTGNTNIGFMEV